MDSIQNDEMANWPVMAKEYESMIEALYLQVNFYKNEHESLKTDITKLITENEELAHKIRSESTISKESSEMKTYQEYDFCDNLQKQINTLAKEKESAINLWQESLKTIDHLESELKSFTDHLNGYVSQEEFERKQQSYLKEIGLLEQLNLDLQKENSIQQEMFRKHSQEQKLEINNIIEKEKEHYNTIKELEAEKSNLKTQLEDMKKEKKDVEIKLLSCEKNIIESKNELKESKMKVKEACQVVDAALLEKDSALLREQQCKEQIEELSKKLTNIVNETKETVKKDLETMKSQYHRKLKIVYQEKVEMSEQLKNKNNELDKLTTERQLLQDENERIKKGNIINDHSNISKMLTLESNMESAFQKLLLSEKKCLQMESERDSIKMDLEQMARNYERDIKSRDVEKMVLESKVETLQKELNLSNTQLKQVADHVKVLNAQIKSIDVEIRQKIYLKDLETKKQVGDINETHALVETELQQNLDAQSILNKRWKSEVRDIATQFENRLRQLKKETTALKKVNKKLQLDLLASESKVMQYENKNKRL